MNYSYMKTDLGNAQRFADTRREQALYVPLFKKWLIWHEGRWVADEIKLIEKLVNASVRELYELAKDEPNDSDGVALRQFAARCESQQRRNAIRQSAEALLAAHPSQLDRHPWLLNTPSGIVNLRDGSLQRHEPALLLTQITKAAYDKDAQAPRWEKFLREVFNDDEELVDYAQRLCGYALPGITSEQVFPISFGDGGNGKSTFAETFAYALGDYAKSTHATTFTAKRDGSIPNDLAALRAARFVIASETNEDRVLDEALVKGVTGGDRIAARFLFGEWFIYEPQFLILYSTNHLPIIKGTDHAIWRRLRVLPFNRTFTKNDKLSDELRAEAGGILAWAVRGCLKWQTRKLDDSEPEAVSLAATRYRDEMDPIHEWLEQRVVGEPSAESSREDLYRSYKSWAEDHGRRPIGDRSFDKALKRRVRSRRSNGVWWYAGVRLRLPNDSPTYLRPVHEEVTS